ncbi:hypothetical protein BS78_02G327700 [Paspalum vaginatum]|nr:hypothetical protein BS78_02G327700 [Paspalum vaginatum]
MDGTRAANEWVIGADLDLLQLMSCPPGFVRNELIIHADFRQSYKWIGVEHKQRPLQATEVSRKDWVMVLLDDDIEFLQGADPGNTCVIYGLLMDWLGEFVEPTIVSKFRCDDLVPDELQVEIAANIHDIIAGCPWRCEMFIGIDFHLQYNEVRALMRECVRAAPACPVCLDKLGGESELMVMPGYAHVFHKLCIAMWFQSRHTCPVCRHDHLYLLPDGYKSLHKKMRPNDHRFN